MPQLIERRSFLKTLALVANSSPLISAHAQTSVQPETDGYKILPKCRRFSDSRLSLGGPIGAYIRNVADHWLKVAPLSNPAMLDMFRDRDRLPRRDLVPWAGEFAGKYLTSAVQIYRCHRDDELRVFLDKFVAQLIACQADDGYLGPWPKESRLSGRAPNFGKAGGDTWDAWGHYHVMLGLLLWHGETGDRNALGCAKRIGDLFCGKFETARLVDTGSTEMNLAPIHALCLLYKTTREARYLKLAEKIRDEFAAKDAKGAHLAGDYLNAALAGREFFQTPKPRWESLHPIMALAELYWISGNDSYRQAFEAIWWSIVKLDRHNNGGFSSGEQAQGNPYHPGAIETCCTVAWIALSVEMLRMTGESIIADELELATLNSIVGLHSPTGRWVTYNTPMDGTRKASAHDIVFQARAGSPELNCCSVNGARGFGMISDWAFMENERGVVVNWYGPCLMETGSKSVLSVKLRQETDYPRGERVMLRVERAPRNESALFFRIPHWSKKTTVKVNGKAIEGVQPGKYLEINRRWKSGDIVELMFDFSLQYWAGERECANKVSIYRGPLLLTYDRRFNDIDPDDLPPLDGDTLRGKVLKSEGWFAPILLIEFTAKDQRKLALCDFGSAGSGGSPYRSWLKVENVAATSFSRTNPRRTG